MCIKNRLLASLILTRGPCCRCWLGGMKGIWPVKKLSSEVLAWCTFAYVPADATAAHYLLLQYNPDCFTFLVPAHLGSPGTNGPLNGCVCVCAHVVLVCTSGVSPGHLPVIVASDRP